MPTMIPINRTFAPLQALVDELARGGVRHAVTSPGSRNAPIALVLAAHPELTATSVIDERAAGFMALGMAKATGAPTVVTCTSGTAAANLLPAIVEAREARVALIVLTADRPPELRAVGAGQAIDQIGIYGSHAKWFVEVGQHDPTAATAVHFRALGARAVATALAGRAGVVHLNLALREPLDPAPEPLDAADWEGRADGRPWVQISDRRASADANDVQALAERIAATTRGVLVCGPSRDPLLAQAAARLAHEAGWPILAEPTSGVRVGEHDRTHVIAGYDVLLREPEFAAAQSAELVLRVGDTPTSKPLRAWLGAQEQVLIDRDGAWHDPTRRAGTHLIGAEAATVDALASALEARAIAGDPRWLDAWSRADALVGPALARAPQPSEPRAYVAAARAVPDGASLWLASSMPIRDVESFLPTSGQRVDVLSNRGANGIDGTVASAAGAALATGRACVLLIGELALLHDLGGLLAAARSGASLTIVCVDNGGGGIFDFLPLAGNADGVAFEQHIATPTGIDLDALARLAGFEHRPASSDAEIAAAVAAGPGGLVSIATERSGNVGVHRAIFGDVAAALAG